jgi:ATP-dependent Clp protease protease subunit
MTAFSYQMAANGDLEISITGTIGDDWSEDPATAAGVRQALKSAPNAKTIRVHIDSLGGSFFEGLSMYQMLRDHGARVEISIGAVAASAASLVAMSGHTISMDETSTMLLHPVWNIVAGNAKELRKAADDLDLLSESAVIAYSSQSGMTADEVRSLLDENRFMGAAEALKLGLCSEIRKRAKGEVAPKRSAESEVRSEIERMRTRQIASATAMRIAAMAPPQTPPEATQAASTNETIPPAPTAPETNSREVTQMTFPLSAVALGLPEGATDTEVHAEITKIKASASVGAKLCAALKAKTPDEALGVVAALQANAAQTDGDGYVRVMAALGASSPDEALGIVEAHKSAKTRLAAAEASLADLEVKQTLGEREEILAKLRHEGKITPAQESDLIPRMSLETLKAFAATAVPIMRGDGRREPGKGGSAGKKWEDMTPTEQRELYATDRAAFDAEFAAYTARAQRA